MYLPLALVSVSLEISNEWTHGAAFVMILSRLIYVPVFVLGIPVARTLVRQRIWHAFDASDQGHANIQED